MKFLIFIFISTISYAQNIVSGNVVSEYHTVLSNVVVVNIGTDKKVLTNNEGIFKIEANINDELRFIKENYERGSKVVKNNDFLNSISIQLVRVPIEIQEVKVVAKPTGNLEKDSKKFRVDKKTTELNVAMNKYMKEKLTEVLPKNSIPSSFAPPNLYAGQVNLLSILGFIINPKESLGIKNDKILNFSETNEFYKKVKESFYGKYYIDYGLDEFEFEAYIIYLDKKYKLAERYYNNFNKVEIERVLKNSLKEFVK